jgi:lipid-A-disaccharide synthase
MTEKLRIGLVAGEASGDRLGFSLMKAIQAKFPDVQFEGVGGPLMISGGMHSLYPMAPLSVMGLVEPLKNLPALLKIRRGLRTYFVARPPDVFIGIDAPDFNLGLELQLRGKGITTIHYVSPSVWAWRQKRVKKIARAVDHMLTLLPFEESFYRNHQVPVTFVGHPLADELPLIPDNKQALVDLGLVDHKGPVVALLPGSRKGEIAHLGQLFLEVARRCYREYPELLFVLPAANAARRNQIDSLLSQFPDLPVKVIDGQSHLAMSVANVVLMASGTTALEAMLLKKPMVVSYKTGWLTHLIVSRMLKVPYVSLPNLLAEEPLVPELLQSEATVDNLTESIIAIIKNPEQSKPLVDRYYELHRRLQCGASAKAAEVVLNLISANNQSERGGTADG